MKTFLKTALLFVAIGMTLNILLAIFRPPYYGNECHRAKYAYFFQNKEAYNAVAFGSSQLHNHIDAPLLDNLLAPFGLSTFNFASEGSINPEHLHLYDRFLKEIAPNSIKYAFIELKDVALPTAEPMTNVRYNYWLSWKEIAFVESYMQSNPNAKKDGLLWGYLMAYTMKHLNFTHENHLFSRSAEEDSVYAGAAFQGFKPLRLAVEGIDPNYINATTRFKADTGIILRDQQIVRKQLLGASLDSCLNNVLLERLQEVIRQSANKGVHVIFVMPPLHSQSNACGLYAIRDRLPKNNVIDLSNDQKYPVLYHAKYHFDDGHLNNEGAAIFTNYLADEMRRIAENTDGK